MIIISPEAAFGDEVAAFYITKVAHASYKCAINSQLSF